MYTSAEDKNCDHSWVFPYVKVSVCCNHTSQPWEKEKEGGWAPTNKTTMQCQVDGRPSLVINKAIVYIFCFFKALAILPAEKETELGGTVAHQKKLWHQQ